MEQANEKLQQAKTRSLAYAATQTYVSKTALSVFSGAFFVLLPYVPFF